MMKKLLVLIAVVVISSTAFSQNNKFEKPNYKKIEKKIKKQKSPFYYPTLMKKYMEGDSTMTLSEKRYLYYGYSFQPAYSPYGSSHFSDSLKPLLQKESLNLDELFALVRFSDSILVDNPFDLRALNYQLYAYKKMEDKPHFEKKMTQMGIIIDALLSSGDGLTKKTAYYVIYVSHEYDLLDILGFKFGGMQSLIEHYDYLKLADNEHGIEGFYFDITPCLNSLHEMFK